MNKRSNKKFRKKLLCKFLIGSFIHFLFVIVFFFFFVIVLHMRVKGKVSYYHLDINSVKDGCECASLTIPDCSTSLS